jgi:ABC-type multidrug transport system fused ATPase/permease subunit
VVIFDKGKLVEDGPHEKLAESSNIFRELVS